MRNGEKVSIIAEFSSVTNAGFLKANFIELCFRYSYKNAELEIFDRRLTYRFGPNMLDCRARDPKDPNFRKLHSKQKV